MPNTYPPPPATTDGTNIEIHHLLRSPQVLSRRLATLASQRFISDALLQGRFTAVGGSILYETDGESVFADDEPEAITPGGAYPQTTTDNGDIAAAKVDKWGEDTPIKDESIARLGINPVNRAFTKVINSVVKYVDSAALSVISSKVTTTYNVTAAGNPGAWSDADNMVNSILQAKATAEATEDAYELDTIVLSDLQWAKAVGMLITKSYLPREALNPVVTGQWPEALGLTWLRTPHAPSTNPMLVDTDRLGGMADEKIGGPGYAQVGGVGVESKSIREDKIDGYLLRARRVTVPVVTEPKAGLFFTNTGL